MARRIALRGLIESRSAAGPRWVLGGIIAVSTVAKTMAFSEVVATIERSALVPAHWERGAAFALLAIEYVLVLVSVLPRLARLSLSMHAAFSSLLFGYSAWRWWEDIRAPCGCFGLLLRLAPWQSALLTSLMCLLALKALNALRTDLPAEIRTTS